MRKIHIFGGGTIQHVRNHLALCAPSYGTTARQLQALIAEESQGRTQTTSSTELVSCLHLTKMADYSSTLETNEDVKARVDEILTSAETAAIVFNVALCDYVGIMGTETSGKYASRLRSREGPVSMDLRPAPKILTQIKQARPDVFLVGFKEVAENSPRLQPGDEMRRF